MFPKGIRCLRAQIIIEKSWFRLLRAQYTTTMKPKPKKKKTQHRSRSNVLFCRFFCVLFSCFCRCFVAFFLIKFFSIGHLTAKWFFFVVFVLLVDFCILWPQRDKKERQNKKTRQSIKYSLHLQLTCHCAYVYF